MVFVRIVKTLYMELLEDHKKGILMDQLHFINLLLILRIYTRIHHKIFKRLI